MMREPRRNASAKMKGNALSVKRFRADIGITADLCSRFRAATENFQVTEVGGISEVGMGETV